MGEKFIIKGGKKLEGIVEVRGSKNSALPILAATLLTSEECVIDNIPKIEDVLKMIDIIKTIGAEVNWIGERKISIKCKDIDPKKLPYKVVGRFRGSVLLLGALLARFDNIKMTAPGGCVIGARPLDTHFDAFRQLGIKISTKGKFYYFENQRADLGDKTIVLDEFSVTATENVLLFSSIIDKNITLKIADQDYQVQELSKVLNKMGAKVKMGFHEIDVVGNKKLSGFTHKLISDPIEAGTFIIMALATKGDVLVKNVAMDYLSLFLKKLKTFGSNLEFPTNDSVKVSYSPKLVVDRIQSLPYPGLQPDLQPIFGVLSTQTKGATMIHDPLYEGRLKYLEELNKMGADIIFCDPHRAIVNGPTHLHGVEIPSLDLRGGASLIIAGLIAQGITTINNAYQVDRGYEKIEERLQALGADIKRIQQ